MNMVDFIFAKTDEFYSLNNGTLESNIVLDNGGHTNFYIGNIDVSNGYGGINVVQRSIYDDGDYWVLFGDSGDASVSFNFFTEKLIEPKMILNLYDMVENIDFDGVTKNMVVELHHIHKGVDDIMQTISIDHAHNDDKYDIIHDSKGNFSIKKR
jgi:hypothetical protein